MKIHHRTSQRPEVLIEIDSERRRSGKKSSRHQITKEMKFNILLHSGLLCWKNEIGFRLRFGGRERSSKEQSTAIGATPSETVQILLRTRLIATDYEFSNLFLLLNRNLVHAPCVSASVECFSFFVLERGGNLGRPGLILFFRRKRRDPFW